MNNVNRETTSLFLSKEKLKTFLNATLYSYSSERHNGIDDVYLNYSAKIQKILNKNITISQMLTDIDKFVDKITEKTNNTEFKYNQNRIKLCLKEFLSSLHVEDIKINFNHVVITSKNKDDNSYVVEISFNSNYVNELQTATVQQLLEHPLLIKKN